MEETIKAYLAGLVDGEGSIFIRVGKVRRKDKLYTHMIPQLSISMTDKETIDFVKEAWNAGTYYVVPRKIWRTQYVVVVSKRLELQRLLTDLLPYLRTKRHQAKLMLEYCEDRHSKQTRAQDLELLGKIQKLNNEGPTESLKI
jgi:hypothetical protein